jgi:hypothetical protein
MFHTFTRRLGVLCAVATLGLGSSALAQVSASDEALKARAVAPKATDIEKAANLGALLAKSKPTDWASSMGAVLEGHVIQVVKSEDGDIRLYLAAKSDESDTRKWVIIEVKPSWVEKSPDLAYAKLWALSGKKVRATGWLFYDTTAVKYPRGTNWELNPATEIVPAK